MEKKFYDDRCHCPRLADFWKSVKRVDDCAVEATTYAHRYADDVDAKKGDADFMLSFDECMKRWGDALEDHQSLFVSKGRGGQIRLKLNNRDVGLAEFADTAGVDDDKYELFCSDCGASVPKLDYSHWGWKF